MSPGLTRKLPRLPEKNRGQTCQAGPLRASAVVAMCPWEQQCPFQLAHVVEMKAAWVNDRFLSIPRGEGYMEHNTHRGAGGALTLRAHVLQVPLGLLDRSQGIPPYKAWFAFSPKAG